MKVEIINDDPSGTRGFKIRANEKRVLCPKPGMFPYDWDESEILELLGEKRYNQFLNGKNQFELTKKEIFAASNDISFYRPIR